MLDKRIIQAGLMIQLLDELTGLPIWDSKEEPEIRLSPGGPPIRKAGGYYLFLAPIDAAAVLIIKRTGYKTMELSVESYVNSPEVWKVYLKPDENYPLSTGIYGIYGRMKPHAQLIVTYQQRWKLRCLQGDYKAGEKEISLYTKSSKSMEDTDYQIREKTDEFRQEFLQLAGKEAEGIYRLERPLRNCYHKSQAELWPLVRIEADARGMFCCYWKREQGDKCILPCEIWTVEGECLQEIEIPAGRRMNLSVGGEVAE